MEILAGVLTFERPYFYVGILPEVVTFERDSPSLSVKYSAPVKIRC